MPILKHLFDWIDDDLEREVRANLVIGRLCDRVLRCKRLRLQTIQRFVVVVFCSS